VSKSDHVIYVIIITTTSDNKVTVTRVKNNLSTNNYTIVNKGIKRATINSYITKNQTMLQFEV
jgi:hypothetical protein